MTDEHHHSGIAGCVEQRTNRKTGLEISLYHAEQAGLDPTGGAWATVCEDHGTIINFETQTQARSLLAHPDEWCDECREITERAPSPPKPFAPGYSKKATHHTDPSLGNCVLCGRTMGLTDETVWLRVVDGGARFANRDEIADQAGDMGVFPIGSTCYAKHSQSLGQGYAIKRKDAQ